MTNPDDVLVDASLAAPAATADPGPPPSSQTPETVQEPQERSGSEDQAAPSGGVPEPKEFDPRWRDPFTGLLYLGHLPREFGFFGHQFRIVTPGQDERIEMGLILAPYRGTLTEEIAYQALLVAVYLQDVDGTKLPQPILNDPKVSALEERFRWVTRNIKAPVIQKIFEECLILDAQVEEVLNAMGEASG
jgi:hypothetical protein